MTRGNYSQTVKGGRQRRVRPVCGRQRARVLKRPAISAARLGIGPRFLDITRTKRKVKVLALVCASFFFLWLCLKIFAQADLWPLLAVPILLSAWFFYEVGVVTTVGITALLLAQTSLENAVPVLIAVLTFALIGMGMSRALRRQRRVHRHVLRSSLTDALTGLYNYGYFMQALDREMHRAERYGGSVTLVMLDLDHFKMFNDRFGHQAGNEALKAVAAVLRREKRVSDIAARYGGEEFALLLPGDEEAGIETAARMRRAISLIQVPVGGGATTGVTVSAGVASYPQGAGSREELIGRADQLLYTSKRKGRNQVSVAPARRQLAV